MRNKHIDGLAERAPLTVKLEVKSNRKKRSGNFRLVASVAIPVPEFTTEYGPAKDVK